VPELIRLKRKTGGNRLFTIVECLNRAASDIRNDTDHASDHATRQNHEQRHWPGEP